MTSAFYYSCSFHAELPSGRPRKRSGNSRGLQSLSIGDGGGDGDGSEEDLTLYNKPQAKIYTPKKAKYNVFLLLYAVERRP